MSDNALGLGDILRNYANNALKTKPKNPEQDTAPQAANPMPQPVQQVAKTDIVGQPQTLDGAERINPFGSISTMA